MTKLSALPERRPIDSNDTTVDTTALASLVPDEVRAVCSAAVDPLEIAAALEAAGVSDTVAKTTFGRADLFALAQELFGSTP
ncbi:MAG TPA: hypothetical protein VEJ87_01490, partial [Acidimicrobiales bacterium]|nr:hypothetical protein [Acidimicrobiales bacterium]